MDEEKCPFKFPLPVLEIQPVMRRGITCYVDPAAQGDDEFAYAIGGSFYLHGKPMLYVDSVKGDRRSLEMAYLDCIKTCQSKGVSVIEVEENGMGAVVVTLFKRTLREAGIPIRVTGVHRKGNKHRRILNALEPIIARNLLVFGSRALEPMTLDQLKRFRYVEDKKMMIDRLDALSFFVEREHRLLGNTGREGVGDCSII